LYLCAVIAKESENEGTSVPSFVLSGMSNQVENRIIELVEEKIAGTDAFIVEVRLLPKNRVVILLDGDQGISIDQCAQVSRYVGNTLEEEDLIDKAYTLEVSSPGIDHPLKFNRQYKKNIGRTLSVKMKDGKIREGKLISVNDLEIEVDEIIKEKGKKPRIEKAIISFDDILEAKVIISFN
jgi:ribosome maturation factor RimP